jgi:hypothetical protein
VAVRFCLYESEKPCTSCGECDRCDLDPDKICDNCCQCIEGASADYAAIAIDEVMLADESNVDIDK